MGSLTYGYAVDTGKLEEIVGSNDTQLVSTLVQKLKGDSFDDDATANRQRALEAIVRGDFLEDYEWRAHQLYALEAICEQHGERLSSSCIGYLDDLGWETKLLERRIPCNIPRADEFPDVSHLAAEEVVSEYGTFSQLEIDEESPEMAEAQEEFLGWLEQCKNKHVGLVTFQY